MNEINTTGCLHQYHQHPNYQASQLNWIKYYTQNLPEKNKHTHHKYL